MKKRVRFSIFLFIFSAFVFALNVAETRRPKWWVLEVDVAAAKDAAVRAEGAK